MHVLPPAGLVACSCDVQDVANLTAFGFESRVEETCVEADCRDPKVANCLVCPQTCGDCLICKEEVLSRSGVMYGSTFNTESVLYKASQEEQLLGLKGVNSIVASSDGRHVYASSYFARSIAAFDRDEETGLITYRSDLGITHKVPQNDETWPFPACNYSHDCFTVGYARPYQGLSQIAISQDGLNIYGVSMFVDSLYVWQRDSVTGSLALERVISDGMRYHGKLVDGLAGASSLFISHNSRSVYVTGFRDQSVAAFHRDDNRTLTFVDRIKNGERRFDLFPVNPPQLAALSDPVATFPLALGSNSSARAARYFVMDGEQYLALAFSEDTQDSLEGQGGVTILRWSGHTFVEVQRTRRDTAPLDIEHMYIVNDDGFGFHFLAVANSHTDIAAGVVNMYRWNVGIEQFVWHHAVPSIRPDGEPLHPHGAAIPKGICYFRAAQSSRGVDVGSSHFLAVAYHRDSSSNYNVDSYVFQWQHEGQREMEDGTVVSGIGFVAFQRMVATGATDFVHVAVACSAQHRCQGSLHFLAVSSFGDETTTESSSSVWRYAPNTRNIDPDNAGLWNSLGRPGYFERVQGVATKGAASVESFHIPGHGYFFAWAERQRRYTSQRWTDYHGRVTIWQIDDALAESCSLTTVSCLKEWQVIDGATSDDGSSQAVHLPGKSIPMHGAYGGAEPCDAETCAVQSMVGPTALKFFSADGEHYLAVAQSVCPFFSGAGCLLLDDLQPQSSILQWNRKLRKFTEMLSITDVQSRMLRGEDLTDDELSFHAQQHSFALRLPMLRAVNWESLEVRADPLQQNRSLLISTSLEGGAVAYWWTFETVVGLNGSSSVASLLEGTEFFPIVNGSYTSPEDGVPAFENLFSVPLVKLSPEQEQASDGVGEDVFVASAMDRSLVRAQRVHAHDMVGNRISEFNFVRTFQQTTDEESSQHQIDGLNNPSAIRFFLQPVVEKIVPERNLTIGGVRRMLQDATGTYLVQAAACGAQQRASR